MIGFNDVSGMPTYKQTDFKDGGHLDELGFCNGTAWELH